MFNTDSTQKANATQFQALYALGIFTVTDLCRYADAHGVSPSELLQLANI